ncbi:stalk domain-containing protein [Paenibacillus doosanensis]|uniref:DL-endopeptidase inhibitor IseA family protein n=1 Tax=Paenibacillus doosanensis TaxID=1229154 RepID=UPI0021805EBD|nr:DL-endopeptidase inhibitor IseA family protein [Paenibacillus doosanensis]MCS7459298.1 stalk domain-containing protein [Paenibacillus doosanensis]
MSFKDKWKGFVLGAASATVLMSASAVFADNPMVKPITATYNQIKLFVNGQPVVPKDSDGQIVEPFIYEGTTYLPIRAIAQALSQQVKWDGEKNSIYIDSLEDEVIPTLALTDQQVMELIAQSARVYEVASGGPVKGNSVCNYESVHIPGDEVSRSYSCGFNTIAEVKKYLGEVFTPDYVDTFIKEHGLTEVNGKLALQAADGGTIYDWDKARIKEKAVIGSTAEVDFEVPVREGIEMPSGESKTSTQKVAFEYVKGQGWRMPKMR